ncbi:bacterial Ig-like domain-containing protein [Lactiplantibacillus brownii]|uniref:bacterial Ig-like domain-containing protein n=1 Tax=Lactiplantibacillus brownii TaxID=3069269 RepID=UPI0038B2B0D3
MRKEQYNKLYYKMYKKGRFWVFAGVAVATMNVGTLISHADATGQTTANATSSEKTDVSSSGESQVVLKSSSATSESNRTDDKSDAETSADSSSVTKDTQADQTEKSAAQSGQGTVENAADDATKSSSSDDTKATTAGTVTDEVQQTDTKQASADSQSTSTISGNNATSAKSNTTTTADSNVPLTKANDTADATGAAVETVANLAKTETDSNSQLIQQATVTNRQQLTNDALGAAAVQDNKLSRANLVKSNDVTVLGSSTWGTSAWCVTSDGVLTIGTGTLGTVGVPWEDSSLRSRITKVIIAPNVIAGDSITHMFFKLPADDDLTEIDGLENLDVSKTTDLGFLFCGDKVADLSGIKDWDTSNVTDMNSMFAANPVIDSSNLPVEHWNVGKVETFNNMFSSTNIQSLDLSNWNVGVGGQNTTFGGMFLTEPKMKSLNVSGWNMTHATQVAYLFEDAVQLQSLDMSGWDLRDFKYSGDLFSGDTNLRSLTLSENMRLMFYMKALDIYSDSELPAVPTPEHTWKNTTSETTYTSDELMNLYSNFNSNIPTGTITYVWSPAVRSSIETKDLTFIAGPNESWGRKESLTKLIDGDGTTDLLLNDNISPWVTIFSVNGDADIHRIDVHTPGLGDRDYTVVFAFTDTYGYTQQATAIVHVLESRASLTVTNQTIVLGQQTGWDKLSPIVTATDAAGKTVTDLTGLNLIASDQPDLTTVGDYPITLTYTDSVGVAHRYVVTVHVVENQAMIATKPVTIVAGPTANFDLQAAVINLTDVNGKNVVFKDAKLVADMSQLNLLTVGDQTVKVTYTDGIGVEHISNIAVHVMKTQASLNAKSSELILGPKTTWDAADNFVSATDAAGNSLKVTDVKVAGTVDRTKVGSNTVTYSYTDSAGNVYEAKENIVVKASQASLNAKSSGLTLGPKTTWDAADNFVSAMDAEGNELKVADVKVAGTVDLTRAGSNTVTYSYTDSAGNGYEADAIILVKASQASLKVKSSELILGPKTTWDVVDNFVSTTDAEGVKLAVTDVKVAGTVDLTKIGSNTVTYSYEDSAGNTYEAHAIIVVRASQASLNVKDSSLILGPKTTWDAADNFVSATDAEGNELKVADVKVAGTVNLTKIGSNTVTYSYTDSAGNTYEANAIILVKASQASLKVKSSDLIIGPKTTWDAADNLVSATDAEGNELKVADVKVAGTVNLTKIGSNTVTYSYEDSAGNTYEANAIIVVKASQASLNAKSSELILGPKTTWDAADNFVSATDAEGEKLVAADVKVAGTVNLTKIGSNTVTYSYTDSAGNTYKANAIIVVKVSQASLNAKSSELILGPKTTWDAADNFVSATDAEGVKLVAADVKVAGTVDLTKIGSNTVTYSYADSAGNTYEANAIIVVKASQASLNVKDSSLILGPKTTWNVADNLVSATDAEGNDLKVTGVKVVGTADLTKVGSDTVTYSYEDSAGNVYEADSVVLVKASKASLKAKSSDLIIGPKTTWDAADNFVSATDAEGNDLKVADVKVVGTADLTKVGSNTVMYSYEDSAGNTYEANAIIVVKASQASLKVKSSDLIIGPKTTWDVTDNFVSATDAEGNDLKVTDVKVAGTVDLTGAGSNTVTYSYEDSAGNVYETDAVILVKASQASLNVKDSSLIIGPKTTWHVVDNFVSATDAVGGKLAATDVKVAGTVNLTKIGSNTVTYSYADSAGNTYEANAIIAVKASQASLKVKSSDLIIGPKMTWHVADNFVSAMDAEGNDLKVADVKVAGTVDLTGAGSNTVTYSYTDSAGNVYEADAVILVKASQASLNVKDSSLTIGPKTTWDAADNFVSATDAVGGKLAVTDVKVLGTVDLTKAGSNTVMYSYTDSVGNIYEANAIIVVKASEASLSVKSSKLILGPKTTWDAADNFVSATDAEGVKLVATDVKVAGTVNLTKTGSNTVTYSYTDSAGNVYEAIANIVVKASQASLSVKSSELILGPKTTWDVADNFVSATDAEGGKLVAIDVKVMGTVNLTKAGSNTVTYSYTDSVGNVREANAIIMVKTSQASLKVKSSEIIAGPNVEWTKANNFVSATDAAGNSLKVTDVKVVGTVDPTKAGSNTVMYGYTDSAGNMYQQVAVIMVKDSQASLNAKFSDLILGPKTTWDVADNFVSATDAEGNELKVINVKTMGTVDLTKAGSNTVTYSYTDSAGNIYEADAIILVKASQASLKVKPSELILGPKTTWHVADNFVSATDAEGNDLKITAVKVVGTVDLTQVGSNTVMYVYTDSAGNVYQQAAVITVKDSQASLKAKSSELIAGPKTTWDVADNFTSATDAAGNDLNVKAIKVTGTAKPTQAGNYTIIYSYEDSAGNILEKQIVVVVKRSKISLHVMNSNLIIGPKTTWDTADNFVSATDAVGNNLNVMDVKVVGTVDLTKAGSNTVTYSYTDSVGNSHEAYANIVVKASQASLNVKSSELIAGPKTDWRVADNFVSATDAEGNKLDVADVKTIGIVDLTKAGSNTVTYSYTDSAGNVREAYATILVKNSKASLYVKPSNLILGPKMTWDATDNFVSATDAEGNKLKATDVKVVGTVDLTQAGKNTVTYSYTDSVGNVHEAHATILVKNSKASLNVKSSNLILGPKTTWSAADDFVSATDDEGNQLRVTDVKVDGYADLTKTGYYQVTYSYVDAAGNEFYQTATVVVKKTKAVIDAHNVALVAGPSAKWTPADSFSTAQDADGNTLTLDQLAVNGVVDPTKANNYPVTYSYTDVAGNLIVKSVIIVVKATQATLQVKDSDLIAGPKTAWHAADNFVSATDAEGNQLAVTNVQVAGTVNTGIPNDYQIRYYFVDSCGNERSKEITVHVVATQAKVNVVGKTVIAGPSTHWESQDNLVSVVTANGQTIQASEIVLKDNVNLIIAKNESILASYLQKNGTTVVVSGNVDLTTAGQYHIKYLYTDQQGNTVTTNAVITVVTSQADLQIQDSKLSVGETWQPADNVLVAKDSNGQPVTMAQLAVTGAVNMAQAGVYPVMYRYTDVAGNVYTATANITVVAAIQPGTGNENTGNSGTGAVIKPDQPVKPVTPTKPIKPVIKPSQNAVTANQKVTNPVTKPRAVSTVMKPLAATTAINGKPVSLSKAGITLPQTNEVTTKSKQRFGVVLLALSGLTGLVGIGRKRRHN